MRDERGPLGFGGRGIALARAFGEPGTIADALVVLDVRSRRDLATALQGHPE